MSCVTYFATIYLVLKVTLLNHSNHKINKYNSNICEHEVEKSLHFGILEDAKNY